MQTRLLQKYDFLICYYSNAAVAGALLGCKFGYDALPKDWVKGLKEKKWLDKKVDRFLNLLGL